MVLYWKTLVLLNESVVIRIAGGCEAHPCVHIKMAGGHRGGFRNIPISSSDAVADCGRQLGPAPEEAVGRSQLVDVSCFL